ncbi:endothelin-converting enzyme [Cryptococcus neoformans]|nr:endothelin-converting enzyme [Cryptococcus neoformans var. grubii Bt1]OXG21624.1 endothelin-converting enzyme [Cryptococcus neoformans var. grubii Tu401-1]OXG31637.1 endothelin-converting enzyme [Cryptococcus neoformans var. grubii Ze90-1]OXH40131.1 endothelin-converting enzyme [Cryptococcus neoformans var. grubii]
MAEPRASTDEESAPLLNSQTHATTASAFSRPKTTREKALASIAVLFLLLASLFIGLFAGAEASFKKEKGKHNSGGGGGPGWGTVTETKTDTQTETATATTTHIGQPTGTPAPSICLTPECVKLAASILSALNTSADPCDDFYQFAVGGWQESNSIPEDRGLYGAFNEVSDNNKKLILKVLSSIPDEKPGNDATVDERNLAKLKAVYTSCMDIDTLNDIGEKPLIDLVEHVLDIFGEFDVSSQVDNALASAESYKGAYNENYKLPDELIAAAAKGEEIKENKKATLTPGAEKEKVEFEVTLNEVDAERRHKLTKTLAWLHSRGVQGLINFAIEGDAGGEDSQIQSLWLYQAAGGLPSKEYYDEAPILDLYHSVIHDILTELAQHTSAEMEKRGWVEDLVALEEELIRDEAWPWPWPGKGDDDEDDDRRRPPSQEPVDKRMDKLASQVLKFEKDLVKAGADPEYLFNPHYAYNPYSTSAVSDALPFLDIPAYLSAFAPRTFPENITVTYPPYLKAVTNLVEQTPDEVLSGYFVTRLALTYADALGPKTEVKKSVRRLQEVLKGIKPGTEENRQDVCLAWVDDIVGFIAGREFVREAFSPEAKSEGERIIRSIVSAFHEKLPHISWMDKESAAAAQKKAEAIIPKVGYPLLPDTTKPESLEAWYARVSIDKEDFFGNVLRSTLVEESRVWLGLGKRRSRDSWEMYPQTVNAYYSPPDGEIVFPAGILQPPFYSLSWPAHLRYGAFGAVAAHELTHAFDNSGSQYDEKGRLRDWWTKKTVEDFEKRAQCVARQYSKYWVYDAEGNKVFVNGNLTNGEDIADSGLAQAYAAWKTSVSDGPSSERLPGLDYSDDQLFFLAFARVWAQLIRPATAVSRIRTDPHSPPYWRVMGTLRNLEAFHQAWGCKTGSRMNPPKEEQCELW